MSYVCKASIDVPRIKNV
jgi:hypothetical protein